MAKRKAGVNKSQMIREALAANPEATTSEIVAVLKRQGLKVTAPFVSVVKSKSKRKHGRKAKRAERRLVQGSTASGNGLMAAVTFIRSAGGIEEAKAAIASIEEIGRLTR